jgi:hypothetical protein
MILSCRGESVSAFSFRARKLLLPLFQFGMLVFVRRQRFQQFPIFVLVDRSNSLRTVGLILLKALFCFPQQDSSLICALSWSCRRCYCR